MHPICNSVHVRVPATSANLGSGFDTVGLALDYHDELTFTLNDDPNDGIAHVIIHGEGADALPCDETHLVVSTFRRACATFGLGRLGFTLEATNNIPQARGMGSSAEAIVAGIAAAAAFAQTLSLIHISMCIRDSSGRWVAVPAMSFSGFTVLCSLSLSPAPLRTSSCPARRP